MYWQGETYAFCFPFHHEASQLQSCKSRGNKHTRTDTTFDTSHIYAIMTHI